MVHFSSESFEKSSQKSERLKSKLTVRVQYIQQTTKRLGPGAFLPNRDYKENKNASFSPYLTILTSFSEI
jgi:hypothetical protein